MKKIIILSIFIFCNILLHAQTSIKPSGSGTKNDPYQISTIENLYWLSQTDTVWVNKYFVQTADINASDTKNWDGGKGFSPIGYKNSSTDYSSFTGWYNGKGHTISGLTINRPSTNSVGLFGYVYYNIAEIDNLGLINVNIIGSSYVGALIGFCWYKCNCVNCYSTGSVTGSTYVGGLVGLNNYGFISNCYSSAIVTGTASNYSCTGGLIGLNSSGGNLSSSYFEGTVISKSKYAGGLAGENGAAYINNCYNKGTVSGVSYVGGVAGENDNSSSITNSYNIGNITGSSDVGGIAGFDNESTISNSYNTGNIFGVSGVGGLAGANTYSSIIAYSYNTGLITGTNYVGGLLGENYSNAEVNNSYNIGQVIDVGTNYVGGFMGENKLTSTISNCYCNVQTSGISTELGYDDNSQTIKGLTTIQMKDSSNLSGLGNFTTTWEIRKNNTYPALRAVSNNAPFAFADSILTQGGISLDTLLSNDYDYETLQSKLTYKIIRNTTHYGSINGDIYIFNSGVSTGSVDTVAYRVGEIIAVGDTLWGNQTTSKLVYGSSVPTNVNSQILNSDSNPYPNPCNNSFVINVGDETSILNIQKIDGQLVLSKQIKNKSTVNVRNLQAGIYILNINGKSYKLIKK